MITASEIILKEIKKNNFEVKKIIMNEFMDIKINKNYRSPNSLLKPPLIDGISILKMNIAIDQLMNI